MKYLALIEFSGAGEKSCAGCDGMHREDTLGYHHCVLQTGNYRSLEEMHKNCPLVPMTRADRFIKSVRKDCNHDVVRKMPDLKDLDSVTCPECGEFISWVCPKSPTLKCEYYGKHTHDYHNGQVMNGEPYYDEDDCIYCGQPDERK